MTHKLPTNAPLLKAISATTNNQRARYAFINTSHLCALIADYVVSLTLELDKVKASVQYRQSFKKALNNVIAERGKINRFFCSLVHEQALDYTDNACEKLERYLAQDVEKLRNAFILNYQRHHVEEPFFLATVDTCGIAVSACIQLLDIVTQEASKYANKRIIPTVNLYPLLAKIGILAEQYRGHIDTKDCNSNEVCIGVQILYRRLEDIEKLISFFDE